MKKLIMGGLSTMIAVVLLIGCNAGPTESVATTSEQYPEKPITLIVPWKAGGETDVSARALASFAEERLKVPVVVENKEGGAATIGTAEAAKAKGDGYTILVATPGPNVCQLLLDEQPYDVDSFKGICMFTRKDIAIVAKAGSEFKTLDDVAQASPNSLSYGVQKGTYNHVLFEAFLQQAGVEGAKHIPVTGGPEGNTNVLNGTTDLYISASLSLVQPLIESGDLQLVGTFSDVRTEAYPEVPTAQDLGYDVVGNTWCGLLVPATTPDEIVNEVEACFKELVEDPEFVELLSGMGDQPYYLDGKSFSQMIATDVEKLKPIVEMAGINK